MAGFKERRKLPRIRRRALVRFRSEGREAEGVILNFSEVGLFIQTDFALPVGSTITIPIRTGSREREGVDLQGRIVWNCRYASGPGQRKLAGMGVELSAAPQEYLRFVAKMHAQLQTRPRGLEERFEVYHRVRFKTGEAFLTEYTENLSRGGMYLATDRPMEPGSTIKAQIEIEGIDRPIEIEGRVAYRLDPVAAQQMGRTAGVGIQFVDLGPEAKAKLYHYIKRLEIHRARPERRQLSREVPNRGSLNDYLVPELLLAFLEREITGTLVLERHGVAKRVFIRNGHPVYVQSNLNSETLGQYLVRQGRITTRDLEDSLGELASGDVHHGEIMVRGGLIDSATLAQSLVEHQEEKIMNTFSWFEGRYEFAEGMDWPPTITMLPLRTYEVVFSGISRWYDAALTAAWMGLSSESALRCVKMPPEDAPVPHIARSMLQLAQVSQSVRQLSTRLERSVSELLPISFGLIVAGWAAFDFTGREETVPPAAPAEQKKAAPAPELLSVLRRWIDEDFSRLREADCYELFSLAPGASEADVTKAYMQRVSRYAARDVQNLDDAEIKGKIQQILQWIRLAYDTLRDPTLRNLYGQRAKMGTLGKSGPDKEKTDRIESERLLLGCIRDIEQNNYQKAVSGLTLAMQMYPKNLTIPGYLGWALFQDDKRKNYERAVKLLESALQRNPTDPNLLYYRGELYAYMDDWKRAEHCFEQSIRIFPTFVKSSVALELARDKLKALGRPRTVA